MLIGDCDRARRGRRRGIGKLHHRTATRSVRGRGVASSGWRPTSSKQAGRHRCDMRSSPRTNERHHCPGRNHQEGDRRQPAPLRSDIRDLGDPATHRCPNRRKRNQPPCGLSQTLSLSKLSPSKPRIEGNIRPRKTGLFPVFAPRVACDTVSHASPGLRTGPVCTAVFPALTRNRVLCAE
jgi:hypothetical protein